MSNYKISEKQINILKGRLTEENIKKLESLGYNYVSSFIDLILHMKSHHCVAGEICLVPYYSIKYPSTDVTKEIEELANSDKEKYGLMKDEYASVIEIRYLDDKHIWYVIDQQWFKGESNTPTHRSKLFKYNKSNVKYCSYLSEFTGIYNELFDMEIFSLHKLIDFYYNNSKNIEK